MEPLNLEIANNPLSLLQYNCVYYKKKTVSVSLCENSSWPFAHSVTFITHLHGGTFRRNVSLKLCVLLTVDIRFACLVSFFF